MGSIVFVIRAVDLIVLPQHPLQPPEIRIVPVEENRSIHSQISTIIEPMKLLLIRIATLEKCVIAKKL